MSTLFKLHIFHAFDLQERLNGFITGAFILPVDDQSWNINQFRRFNG
jgi:hypothetical protein